MATDNEIQRLAAEVERLRAVIALMEAQGWDALVTKKAQRADGGTS